MKKRLNLIEKGSSMMKPLFGVKKHLDQSPLKKELIELVSFRVSQINGCAVCLDMHSKELISQGESSQRLFLLNAWRETPLFSAKERAALAWAEALTLLHENNVPDSVYDEAAKHFSETELLDLALSVGFINVANRLNIAFATPAANYDAEQVINQLSQST
ncbi:carboxymuconolactone decarboxylase family protein [Algoriphagus resistens]|uniref:carboxymuconolactone decarboxylase family protein n=1 Tax=Algoriphagus resistens TaxID=1750590 RepID=UPI000716997B|nr:carboxymuconolactone decarboxylase family protein [Algoriphagus resistens]